MEERLINARRYACVVPSCPGQDSAEINLFKIPVCDAEAWCRNLGIDAAELNTTARVCSRHFDQNWLGSNRLKAGARPSLHLATNEVVEPPILKNTERRNIRKCSIMGCSVTSPSLMTRFPDSDPARLEKWLSVCVLKDETAEHKVKFICERHFEPDMFASKGRLKRNAIPIMDSCIHGDGDDEVISTVNMEPVFQCDAEEQESDDFNTLDGLECKRCCYACHNNFVKYYEKCLHVENQLEAVKAKHKKETKAFQKEILMLKKQLRIVKKRNI